MKVPLIGVFSAGKSSLLNVFTGKPGMLPVDTMPETAVAYELYFSEMEVVELFRDGTKVDSKPLADIAKLDTKPGDIAKVFCNSIPVKKLQERGIILVDMPGIGSGIERHDAAIANYIDTGTAFVLVVDVEQGSLRGNTLAFMNELIDYKMNLAVVISKTDKKPETDVNDIAEYIRYQLTKLGHQNPYVSTACAVNGNLSGLTQYLESLDANQILAEKLSAQFKQIVKSVTSQLKTRIDVRTKDIADVDEKLKAIEEEIENVKAELPTTNSTADTPEKSTQDILDNVRAALEAKATDIAQMIINRESQESIKAFIISIVRKEIVISIQEESKQYSAALGQAVQESIKNLSVIEVDGGFMDDFGDMYGFLYSFLGKFLNIGGIWGKIIGFILPVLPKILNWLFGKSDDEILEEVRAKVIGQGVNQLIEGLHPTVFKMVEDNQQKIRNKIQEELVAKMEKVKEGLREKIADATRTKEDVQSELNQLNTAISELNAIAENL
ncbi:dynamin family protein [Prevotella sp. HUN102]|uniref:dynamin family protein n=1 Tax=Prevotella sp. HUN102 TaxID=1392486 RepID=UPI0018CC6161|nr:dynamin family protein [Prevotella sp. HUN102]